MNLTNPQSYLGQHPDPQTNEMMSAVISWFEKKGLKSIKQDWHEKTWNYDFVEFMKSEQVLATLMTPAGYGQNAHWDTLRNVEFAEIAAFYGITFWYTFQVSMLGLGPIFNGDNEAVKHKAAQLLKEGKVFAFGLSEKEHGADIYSSDMRLVPQADGSYLARVASTISATATKPRWFPFSARTRRRATTCFSSSTRNTKNTSA